MKFYENFCGSFLCIVHICKRLSHLTANNFKPLSNFSDIFLSKKAVYSYKKLLSKMYKKSCEVVKLLNIAEKTRVLLCK